MEIQKSTSDVVQFDVDEAKMLTVEYVIDGLDRGGHLCNSALAKYEIHRPDGTKSLSLGQILQLSPPLSINTFDGFDDETGKEVISDSEDEWPYCSKLYSPTPHSK